MQHDVLGLDELGPDELKEVEVGETKLLLARDGERVFATGAKCTHKGAPLKNGTRVANTVICPWHHAIFDLDSGDHIEPPGQGCLTRFVVSVQNGRIMVEVPEGAHIHRPEVAQSERKTGGDAVFAIIGTGAAGLACAQELVKRGFDGRIVMIGQEDTPPYDRTDLSKAYLKGGTTPEKMTLASRDELHDLGIERVHARVTKIDAEARHLTLEGKGAPSELTYDACFAAPGSGSAQLPIENADMPNVFTLRSLNDGKALLGAAEVETEIVIVGSGFIGMEAAAALAGDGRNITVVTPEELPFASKWGDAVARQITEQHKSKGVTMKLGARVEKIEASDGMATGVTTEGGETIRAGLIILAVGAKPNLDAFGDLAKDGKVSVDANLRAADRLWVGGDVADFPLYKRGYSTRIEHWRVAEQHGRHAARAMLGDEGAFAGVPFFWSAQYGPIHYVGHAESYDDVHIEGDIENGSYTAFYIKNGKVIAGIGRGKADVTAELHAAMLSDPAPSAEKLKAAEWKPQSLIV
ncbi:dioxygenase, ferredoxin reductase component, putative [Fulvimarina pelagi HTCC2506]|uniref:Dioxygenase, ferredoxin reductase component, putative n=1 Tax=Fulvimarina pelagi HTCC2506 TaxID=314231 RepID=Q0G4S8_9HYPH|nr:FAD-dependent oxidoreductase [Fulvimarina pelagi]EAU43336.1 dioxygenase, ferredoxin reductase component, putative [Fulvimarina pelagi HTCC2506]